MKTAGSYYRVCGLTLKANISFPELARCSATQADCTLSLRKHNGRAMAATKWVHKSVRPNGKPRLLVGQSEDCLVMRFPRLADFVVSPSEKSISCFARPKTPKNTIRHFFLDHVLPAYLSLGRLVLHASAVRVSDKSAIAFLGESGSGKSTLAACFWKDGFQVLADDCVVVEQGDGLPMCVPSYPGLRLWNDSAKAVLSPGQKRLSVAHYTDKARFKHAGTAGEFDGRPVPLSRIYWLEPAEPGGNGKIQIRPISGSQGVIQLLQSSFRLNFNRPKPLLEEFNRLVRMADSKLLYGVSFPRDFRRVGEVTRTILDDIGNRGVGLAQE
jgi:hypothetical protein